MATYALPWLCLHTDILEHPKIIPLNRVQRLHFIEVLIVKRRGLLDMAFRCTQDRDSLMARMLSIGKKSCANLKKRLMEVELIDDDWQPLGWYERQKYAARWERILSQRASKMEQDLYGETEHERDDGVNPNTKRTRRHREAKRQQAVTVPETPETFHETDETVDETPETFHETDETPSETHTAFHETQNSVSPYEKTSDNSTTYEASLNIDIDKDKDKKEDREIERGGERAQARAACAATAHACDANTEAPAQAPLPPALVKKVPAKVERGSRLPADWVLLREWGEWALEQNPHWTADDVRREAEKFANYWHAKAGKDARKCDWLSTWKNWIYREIDYSKGRAGNGKTPAQPALQSLSFKERDTLNAIELDIALGFPPPPQYEELKRRAAAFKNLENDRMVIDISDCPQYDGVGYAGT